VEEEAVNSREFKAFWYVPPKPLAFTLTLLTRYECQPPRPLSPMDPTRADTLATTDGCRAALAAAAAVA
jgi:hypothetical protein